MKNTFLVGSFLPGYGSAFRYNRPKSADGKPAFDRDALSSRFESRARKIKQKGSGYMLRIQASLLVALVLMLFAFTAPFSPEGNFDVVEVAQELVTMEEILQTQQLVSPPPPPRPVIPVLVPDDEILDEDDLELDVALELDELLVEVGPPPSVPEEADDTEPEVFVVVEDMPRMIGGMASLFQSVRYPEIALKNGIEGNVIVKIVVDEQGTPLNPLIMRSASPLLNAAAIEAVMKQKFEPGRQRGRAVKVEIVIPVRFRLT